MLDMMALLLAMLAVAPEAEARQPAPTGDSMMSAQPTAVVARWQARIYGFAEADFFADSTQSLVDLQGNQLLAAPHTTAADAGRVQFSERNSRLGVALESPLFRGMKTSGVVESDFLGYNPAPGSTAGASESSFYNGVFRLRHAWARLSTPVVDVLAGQAWQLLGFNPVFTPGSVSLQGLPNEIFLRTPQLRLSHLFDLGAARIEAALALQRPGQRDSAAPDFVGGLRVELPGWQGYKSTASAAGGLSGIQLAVSGIAKQFRVLKASPASDTDFETATGNAVAVDAIVPIVPATKESRANALTFVGEATTGTGYSDNFTGLSAGTAIGAPPGAPATFAVAPGLDAGDAGFGSDTGKLETVDWRSLLLNLQYYTPVDNGSLWLNLLYSELTSDNTLLFAKRGAAFGVQRYASLGALYDVTPAFRVGVEGTWTQQKMTDGSQRINRRAQLLVLYNFL